MLIFYTKRIITLVENVDQCTGGELLKEFIMNDDCLQLNIIEDVNLKNKNYKVDLTAINLLNKQRHTQWDAWPVNHTTWVNIHIYEQCH